MSGRSPAPVNVSRSQDSSPQIRASQNAPASGDEPSSETPIERSRSDVRPEVLPPIASARRSPTPIGSNTESAPARSLHVHNILNPTQLESGSSTIGQQAVPQLGSPASTVASRNHSISSISRPLESEGPISRKDSLVSTSSNARDGEGGVVNREPRRILTPKSLSSLPASTLGRMTFPGTINAQESPFLPSQGRSYTGEAAPVQVSDGFLFSDSPIVGRISGGPYAYPPSAPTPPPGSRRGSMGTMPAPLSQSASPSTSYSSFSQQSQTSPAPQHGSTVHQRAGSISGYPPAFGAAAQPGGGTPQNSNVTNKTPFRSPSDALPQSGVQLLTLATEHGPIQVPVDVQAASKMADDKRKRNAGASARFRQRRKEKEREASQTIAKLEQQIRDGIEERDFYRQERDFFRRIVSSGPGHAQVPPRPVSPRLRRGTPIESPDQRNDKWHESGSNSEPERNTRRRTNAYSSGPTYSLPPPSSVIAANNHPSTHYGLPPMLSPRFYDAQAPSSGVPAPASVAGKAEPYEPSLADRSVRGWQPSRDHR
ncbi:MAG: hypothetical protein M1837_002452 [Sclerophora amabilis]|nr:MAG: hypothetical protein M1837_002452 [Sclerophora amabilis]